MSAVNDPCAQEHRKLLVRTLAECLHDVMKDLNTFLDEAHLERIVRTQRPLLCSDPARLHLVIHTTRVVKAWRWMPYFLNAFEVANFFADERRYKETRWLHHVECNTPLAERHFFHSHPVFDLETVFSQFLEALMDWTYADITLREVGEAAKTLAPLLCVARGGQHALPGRLHAAPPAVACILDFLIDTMPFFSRNQMVCPVHLDLRSRRRMPDDFAHGACGIGCGKISFQVRNFTEWIHRKTESLRTKLQTRCEYMHLDFGLSHGTLNVSKWLSVSRSRKERSLLPAPSPRWTYDDRVIRKLTGVHFFPQSVSREQEVHGIGGLCGR